MSTKIRGVHYQMKAKIVGSGSERSEARDCITRGCTGYTSLISALLSSLIRHASDKCDKRPFLHRSSLLPTTSNCRSSSLLWGRRSAASCPTFTRVLPSYRPMVLTQLSTTNYCHISCSRPDKGSKAQRYFRAVIPHRQDKRPRSPVYINIGISSRICSTELLQSIPGPTSTEQTVRYA